MKGIFIAILVMLVVCLFPVPTIAQVQISEIYPAPSLGAYEWVELYNNSEVSASLALYDLHDSAHRTIALPAVEMQPHGYIIATSAGVLNNSGDTVVLRLNDVIIDSITYTEPASATESFVPCAGEWILTDVITPAGINHCPMQTEPSPTPPVSTPTNSLISAAQVTSSTAPMNTPSVPPSPQPSKPPKARDFNSLHAVKAASTPTTLTPTPTPVLIDAASCKAIDVDSFKPYIAGILACGFITGGIGCYSLYQKLRRKGYNNDQDDSNTLEIP